MFNSLIAWFDARYSPVGLAAHPHPPMGLRKFVLYFVDQFRTAFLIRLVLVAIGSVADAMMPIFVGLVARLPAAVAPVPHRRGAATVRADLLNAAATMTVSSSAVRRALAASELDDGQDG